MQRSLALEDLGQARCEMRGSLVLLLLLSSTAVAQELQQPRRVELLGEAPRLTERLLVADKHVHQQEWPEAVEEYVRILEEAGDQLVPADLKDGRHCVQARRLCHLRLAALPPAARKLYQDRVDAQARRLLQQGRAERDANRLRRIVHDYFCSSVTGQAIELLGDLAFEQGDFAAAERWYRMLTAKIDPASLELAVPEGSVDRARVQARQTLTWVFRGDRVRFEAETKGFRQQYPQARGDLAGKNGNYADILQALTDQIEPPPALPRVEALWPTFGGAASRNQILSRPPGRLAQLRQLDPPQWRVRLDGVTPPPGQSEPSPPRVVPPSTAARSLAYHPVLAGKQVLLTDAWSVRAYDLASGRLDFRYDLVTDPKKLQPAPALPAPADASYTATVVGERVYARLGNPILKATRAEDDTSHLVCLHRDPQAVKRELWRVPCGEHAGAETFFEGAPVVAEGRVHAALTSFVGERALTTLACYDAETGAARWRQEVCRTQELKEGEVRHRHHLLTLAEGYLVYCSHSGAIVALEAATGRRSWSVRYTSRGPRLPDRDPSPRALTPVLCAAGRLYVAPLDYDRILCLDAETGRQLWESSALEVVHLLGVARDRLVVTTRTPYPGIRALEASTGRDLREWMHPADGSDLPSYGRGLLAGDQVLWPTRDGLRVLRQDDGEPLLLDGLSPVPTEERLRYLGNLAANEEYLVVTSAEEMLVYGPEKSPLTQTRVVPRRPVEVVPASWSPPRRSLPPLTGPLARSWHVRLLDQAQTLETPLPHEGDGGDLLFLRRVLGRTGLVSCRHAATGRELWSTAVDHVPTSIGVQGDHVVLAGSEAVTGHQRADGKLRWKRTAAELLPTAERESEALSGFRVAGSRLLFFHGPRRLLALEISTGKLAWETWAPGGRVRPLPPGGRFHPIYHADEQAVLLQTTAGQRLLLDAVTGKVRQTAPTSRHPWPRSPVARGSTVLFLPDRQRLRSFDLATGTERWVHVLDRPTGLNGEPPQILLRDDLLLLLVGRNHAHELERLDPETGRLLWRRELEPRLFSLEESQVALDDHAVYLAGRNRLVAHSLESGTPLWQTVLPDSIGLWRLDSLPPCLLLYPPRRRPEEPFTMLLHAARDGQLVQRLNFPVSRTAPWVEAGPRGLVVVLDRDAWGLSASEP